MCWESRSIPYLNIAFKDIPVFKVVKKDYSAYYQPFCHYSLNKVYTTNLGTPLSHIWRGLYQINEGFHSYSTKKCRVKVINNDRVNTYISVLYDNIRLDHYVNATVMKCVIPKGAQYYVNERGEYVSESILPLK